MIFYLSITSSQNAKGFRHLPLLRLIKPRNHEDIFSSTKSCYSGRNMQETAHKTLAKMACFVCGWEEQSQIMLVCAVTNLSKVK